MGGLLREDAGLTASWFTLTGAALTEPPRHTLRARFAAARAAGFTAVALSAGALDEHDPAAIRRLLDDARLEATELEPLRGWDDDGGARETEELLYGLAEATGARQINAIQVVGDDVPADVVAERFAGVCARAAGHGVRVAFEPRANSPVSTPAGALALIEASGRAEAGIVLDAYHVHRAGVTLDDLAAVPVERIASIQLNDMYAIPRGTAFEDAVEHRLVPGAGDIDLPAWLAGLDTLGVDAPLAVEVLWRDLTTLDVEAAAERAAQGARAALAGARALAAARS